MRPIKTDSMQRRLWLRGWRPGWLAFLVLLCSCRSVPQGKMPVPSTEDRVQNRAAVDSVAQAVETVAGVPVEHVVNQGLPIPVTTVSPWAPPGIAGPWPHDEYLEDGGDREVQANIGPEGEVRGLEIEDTVMVYDTIDGQTVIEPSNRVCLYSPRFAAVRKVTSVLQNEQREQLIGVELPVKANLHREERLATTAVQPIQPEGEIATRQLSISRVGERTVRAISRQPIAAMAGGFALHENFKVIRQGTFEESEKARLMEMVDAAITWSHDKAVQVVLEGQQAVDVTGDQRVQATYRLDVPNHPCLRVIKVASTKTARPGDIVDFTIRFDNLGDQEINHVVLIDNLTTRLEYVQGSAQSSREAEFSTERNEGDSLVLRWDFSDPLEVGQGGLVRFHCRVR
ncbi:MAG: DUF11 domain-containing protein [Planctomycetia bacterium]|nr:DUF11 domain-containing protein [Planctomycetia bacterium]